MSTSEYIFAVITLFVMFGSFVISTRKSGYIAGLGMSRGAKNSFDKSGLGDYCRIMLLVIAGFFIFGSFVSQDLVTVVELTALNAVFVGYALAWEKIIKQE